MEIILSIIFGSFIWAAIWYFLIFETIIEVNYKKSVSKKKRIILFLVGGPIWWLAGISVFFSNKIKKWAFK